MNIKFLFRFNNSEMKQDFHIRSIKLNKSMNELLNELVEQFLNKEING